MLEIKRLATQRGLKRNALFVCLLLGLAWHGAVQAHHGFGGKYNLDAPIYIEGTVSRAYFGYPHAEIVLRVNRSVQSVKAQDGIAEFSAGLTFWREALGSPLEIEFPPVNRFFDLAKRVKIGDRVAVIALRNCEKPFQLRGQWIAPAKGPVVIRSGQMQSEVRGC